MEPLVSPPEDSTGSSIELPKWAYGVIAGGCALLAGAAVTIGHVVAKKRRQAKALEDLRKHVHEQDQLTPRGPAESPRGLL